VSSQVAPLPGKVACSFLAATFFQKSFLFHCSANHSIPIQLFIYIRPLLAKEQHPFIRYKGNANSKP
jgi:hypothetical protein